MEWWVGRISDNMEVQGSSSGSVKLVDNSSRTSLMPRREGALVGLVTPAVGGTSRRPFRLQASMGGVHKCEG